MEINRHGTPRKAWALLITYLLEGVNSATNFRQGEEFWLVVSLLTTHSRAFRPDLYLTNRAQGAS